MMIRKRVYSALITLSLATVAGYGATINHASAASSGSATSVSSPTSILPRQISNWTG